MTDRNAPRPLPSLRVARPARDLAATIEMYCAGLGFDVLGSFRDHDGFDGVMVGRVDGAYHLEFTHERGAPPEPAPGPENLCVFYLPDEDEWRATCDRMVEAGFRRVASHNPYWDVAGRTFEDVDGYRVVMQHGSWPAQPSK